MVRRVSALLIAILLPLALFGGTVGKIIGVAIDKQSGKPLMGVNVVIKGTSMGAASDIDGRFYIFNIPPGIYEVEATYIGYARTTIQNIRISVDLTTDVNLSLERENVVGQEVIVVAGRPVIEKSSTNERRIVRSEDIENLPVRGATDIAALQTGVVKVGTELHVRGGRTEEVVYYVDGVYQVNEYNRITRPEAGEVSSSALEEVSYQAGGFDAEYGSATAGIINMSTKIGSEKYQMGGEFITDGFLSTKKPILGTYSYGYNLYNLSGGGPVPGLGKYLRFFGSLEVHNELDRRTSAGAHPVGTWTGDTDGDGLKDYNEFTWKSAYGPFPDNSSKKIMGAGNLMLDLSAIKVKIGGNFTRETYREYDLDYAVFCPENVSRWETFTGAAYTRLTWTINPKTLFNIQGSYFIDKYENGNNKYWDDLLKIGVKELPLDKYLEIFGGTIKDTSNIYSKYDINPANGYIIVNPYLPQNGSNPTALNSYATFYAPGTQFFDYLKNETGHVGINGDLKTQVGFHELKFGFEYRDYTIRYYRCAAPERLAYNYLGNPPYAEAFYDSLKSVGSGLLSGTDSENYGQYTENYWFRLYKNAYAENIGYTIDGKDYVDGDVTDNRDSARKPKVGGLYLQDKIEMKDLVLNVGFRYDYISPNNLRFRDPAKIVLDSLGQIAYHIYKDEDGEYSSYAPTTDLLGNVVDNVGIDQMILTKNYHIISPRLGMSFPVTDMTVFHAQYGKYVQQPQLNRMFVSFLRFAANLEQGNFTISGNPNLEPVKTTAYEVGFQQQLGSAASVDLTAFYKELTGYIQVRNVVGATPVVYATYVNGDYGTVKGLSFSFNLRRTGYVQALVNYTLQYAGGTGSTANTQYKIAWQGGNYPTFVSPLDFDQRHTGSINLDFRTTDKDKIGRAGMNFLFTFGSGRRYTPTIVNSIVFPTTSDVPVAAMNSGTMPFVSQLDVKIDKTFNVLSSNVTVYFWIENVLNTRNVRLVYTGTGMANEDGWLETDAGKQWVNTITNQVALYNLYQADPFNYETPRIIRLGVKFDI